MDDQQGESSLQPANNLLHRLREITVLPVTAAHHQCCHLGIGFAQKLFTLGKKLLFELVEVFDDAVMNQSQFATITQVGVGVFVSRTTVGGPPGVSNAGVALCQGVVA
ncbi:unannotated protein [freshwater metagenome]|uniref:Unannotated protein n=1 Tax=freshwater metagenome TaxID=449393 RepID=A0A6J6JD70_9ZZZZ